MADQEDADLSLYDDCKDHTSHWLSVQGLPSLLPWLSRVGSRPAE
jgi:hypothetical protein